MDDSATLMETLLQWMSTSPSSRPIDRELGDLRKDMLGPAPLLWYLRYNVTLDTSGVEALKPGLPPQGHRGVVGNGRPGQHGSTERAGWAGGEAASAGGGRSSGVRSAGEL